MTQLILLVLLVRLALALNNLDPVPDFSEKEDWDSSYTTAQSTWDRPSVITGRHVVTGLGSTFDTGKKDRKFKLRTSTVDDLDCYLGDVTWSSWANGESGEMDFVCDDNEAIGEIQSSTVGSNDRRFKFKCCNIESADRDGTSRFNIHSIYKTLTTGTQNGFTLECNRNEVLVGIWSRYDSSTKDRWYSLYCGLLVNYERRDDAAKTILTDERFLLGDLDSCYHEGKAWSPIYGRTTTTTAADCQMDCAGEQQCARWSWHVASNACLLAEATAVPYEDPNYTSGYKKGCYRVESCPWDLIHSNTNGFRHTPPTSGRRGFLVCRDGSQCEGGGCCANRGMNMLCEPGVPFMCKAICGSGDHCCAESLEKCESWYSGLRGCDREETRARECTSVTVTDTPKGGDYFSFDVNEWIAMTGNLYDGHTYDVTVMSGTFNWRGTVKVWWDGAGRKDPSGRIHGDWQIGYQIMLTDCVTAPGCVATTSEIWGDVVHTTTYSGTTDEEKDASCCAKCKQNSECEYWVRDTDNGNCWLGKNAGITKYRSDRRGGFGTGDAVPQPCPPDFHYCPNDGGSGTKGHFCDADPDCWGDEDYCRYGQTSGCILPVNGYESRYQPCAPGFHYCPNDGGSGRKGPFCDTDPDCWGDDWCNNGQTSGCVIPVNNDEPYYEPCAPGFYYCENDGGSGRKGPFCDKDSDCWGDDDFCDDGQTSGCVIPVNDHESGYEPCAPGFHYCPNKGGSGREGPFCDKDADCYGDDDHCEGGQTSGCVIPVNDRVLRYEQCAPGFHYCPNKGGSGREGPFCDKDADCYGDSDHCNGGQTAGCVIPVNYHDSGCQKCPSGFHYCPNRGGSGREGPFCDKDADCYGDSGSCQGGQTDGCVVPVNTCASGNTRGQSIDYVGRGYCAYSSEYNLDKSEQPDFNGRYLGDDATLEDCVERCRLWNQCNYFSFAQDDKGACLLFRSCPTLREYQANWNTFTYKMPTANRRRLDMPWVESGPGDVCQEDCDDDNDCYGDLLCYHRDTDDVPGCRGGKGWQDSKADFCYDPNLLTGGHGASHLYQENDDYVQNGSPILVAVGPSDSTSKTIKDVGVGGLTCPSKVNKYNWLSEETYADEFDVEVIDGKHVKVTVTNDGHTDWGLNLRIMCAETDTHAVIVGYSSIYNTDFNDRRFQFYSTQIPGLDCKDDGDWTDYQNAINDVLDFVCPDDHVLTGISSKYSSDKADRQYRFKCCDVKKAGYVVVDKRSTGSGSLSNHETVAHDQQCAANEVAIGMSSTFHTGWKDRYAGLWCGVVMVPARKWDDCSSIEITSVEMLDGLTFEDSIKSTASLSTTFCEAKYCGYPNAGGTITIKTEVEEEIKKADTISLTKSLDKVYSFSAALETVLTWGAGVQTTVQKFITEKTKEMHLEFSLGGKAEASGQWAIGSEATQSTVTVQTTTTTTALETEFDPLPFEWWMSVGTYSTQRAHMPMIMTTRCLTKSGEYKSEKVNATFVTDGYSQISITMEDKTDECDFSYVNDEEKEVFPYEECVCMENLQSHYVGSGCQVHPEFDGFKGCYVYKGIENADKCLNGQSLGVAPPTQGIELSKANYDYPVSGVQFGWSYVACGGDQFYPGDPSYDGPEYDDLVYLSENSQCIGNKLSDTKYESRNSAIQACYNMNEMNSNSCLGVYDALCDGIADFYLCSPSEGLPYSDNSCVWRMQGVDLVPPAPTETPTAAPTKCEDESTDLCKKLAKDDGCMDLHMLEQCPITCGTNCEPCEDSSVELCDMLKSQGGCEDSDPEERAATLEMCPISCGTYCFRSATPEPTRQSRSDPTAKPTVATAPPTTASSDQPGTVMVRARLNVGTNSKGKLKTKYFSKNGATISFNVDGAWTSPLDFFDSCKKSSGGICPAEYATYGPFAAQPSAVKIAMKDRAKKNGDVAPFDDLYTGNISVQTYPTSGNVGDAADVCTDSINQWIDGTVMERTYTFPATCPCDDLDLEARITANIEPDFPDTQKLQVSVYLPCRQEWQSYNFNYKVKEGIPDGDKRKTNKHIKEYPSKIRVTNLSTTFTPTLTELKFKTVPNTMEKWEMNLLLPENEGYAPVFLDEAVEYSLTYSKMDGRGGVTCAGHSMKECTLLAEIGKCKWQRGECLDEEPGVVSISEEGSVDLRRLQTLQAAS